MMKSVTELKHQVVFHNSTILDAINQMDRNAGGVLFVTDKQMILLGTLTDGDIRRALLSGKSLEMPVSFAMRKDPIVARENTSPQERLALMYARNISALPVLTASGVFVGAVFLQNQVGRVVLPNEAVIMCGGLGTRLGELTRNCPKPMLRVGGVPILERIIKGLSAHGIVRLFLATNYLREQIEGYFGDGSQWNLEIRYLHESKRMGTGGALSLLPHRPDMPMLIMNGDILTDLNFNHFLDFHNSNGALATMGIVEFKYQNPYGVIRYEDFRLIEIEEKPMQSCFINSGIYVINPGLLDFVPEDEFIDMPTVLLRAQKAGGRINVYPIYENWLDIGRHEDFNFAQTLI